MNLQLLEVTRIPYEFQFKVKNGGLEYKRGTVEMEVSRSDDGGLDIKSSPIQLKADTFDARNSMRPTTATSVRQSAEAGKAAAYQATAVYAQQGKLVMNAKIGEDVMRQIASAHIDEQTQLQEANLEFLPDTGAQIDWEEGSLQIQYDMEKMNFDWKVEKPQFTFTPPDVEFHFKAGDLKFKYTGGPIYVPASSDPNYKPVDVKA